MRLEQRKSPRLETRVGNKGLIAISKPPFLRVVMIVALAEDFRAMARKSNNYRLCR